MISETNDYQMILRMLLDDKELYDRISDDFTNPSLFNPTKSLWLGYFEDNTCKALLSVDQETAIVVNIHIHIPSKYRGKQSFEMGNGLLQYLIKNCDSRIKKINAKIPTLFPDVIRFAEKCGLSKEGVDRCSYVKNGLYYDRILMGVIINE